MVDNQTLRPLAIYADLVLDHRGGPAPFILVIGLGSGHVHSTVPQVLLQSASREGPYDRGGVRLTTVALRLQACPAALRQLNRLQHTVQSALT